MKNLQDNFKVAIVYDRVNKWGGAERVLLALHKMFPSAPLYTSVYDNKNAPWAEIFPKVYTSFLQKIPIANKFHEGLAVFMPMAFELFDFSGYDLVISVTSEFAKGIITKPTTFHLCYCLTPVRYLWSGYGNYFKNPLLKLISKPFVNYLMKLDVIMAQRPDKIIAISKEVKRRIKEYYNLESEVIFPPVSSNTFNRLKQNKPFKGSYFLVVSRLVGYKKVDLVIKTFNKINLPLVVIGAGWQKWKLKFMARKNIKFVEKVTDEELVNYYINAKALIVPQLEDFGLVSIEAQSNGTPVVGFGAGGNLDTVINGKTGILFEKQNVASLLEAIAKFDKISFNHSYLLNNARRFNEDLFKKRIQEALVCANLGRRGRNSTLA